LPEALVTPRLAVPRRTVPAGSVGIAGSQTGVYPFVTSGGWRLLGRTPLHMVQGDPESVKAELPIKKPLPQRLKPTKRSGPNVGSEGPTPSSGAHFSLLSIGDRVRFTPISRERFASMEQA